MRQHFKLKVHVLDAGFYLHHLLELFKRLGEVEKISSLFEFAISDEHQVLHVIEPDHDQLAVVLHLVHLGGYLLVAPGGLEVIELVRLNHLLASVDDGPERQLDLLLQSGIYHLF